MFKLLAMFILTALMLPAAYAVKLSDYEPYHYEVLFTNPDCGKYRYDVPVFAVDGSRLYFKPVGAYCKTGDLAPSAEREDSPQFRLIEWIDDPKTNEIFMAYLSFSNRGVSRALCDAVKRRGMKLTIVLDAAPEAEEEGNELAEGLKECGPSVVVHYRGNRSGLGYAHNKIFMVNPDSATEVKFVFSSGNMSTGTAIHHENWNFITTSPESYFAQAHLCLRDALLNHGDSKQAYQRAMSACKGAIEVQEEEDIKTFFVPGEGTQAFNALKNLALKAYRTDAIAHRFSGKFITLFDELLDKNKNVRLITDDDMYWSYKTRADVGRNTSLEAYKFMPLVRKGLPVKYMETNHAQVLLQHNKFMVFENGRTDAVFTGAGNLTSSAFSNNMENFYVITIPEVTASFQEQYKYMWDELATAPEKMPKEDVLP